jgi:dienelactone hydrolase
MQEVMGPLPRKEKRCPLEMKVEQEVDCGSYTRQLITYAAEPGSRVPAYLLVPKNASRRTKRPAILALHPTDMEYGHRVVVETLRNHYRAYAVDLVERGYVVLAPAYPLMANYQPDLKAVGYQSGTMKAIWDNIRGLDLFETLPFVRKRGFGAVGHSLGGHNAIYTAVFDERIKVVVSSCGFDSYVDYMDGKIKGWTSDRYMPKLLAYQDRLPEIPFDFHELIGALAPRPVFINAPLGDTNFKWRSVDEVVKSAKAVYRLYGSEANLHVEHPDCGHDFPLEIREGAYEFLGKHLR